MAKNEEPKTEPREYVVLQRVGETFNMVGIVKATSARRAIDDRRDGGGRWVAVPLRNWNEEDLEVVQRDPTVKRTRVHPGQTEIPVQEAAA